MKFKTTSSSPGRAGFTLVECLVYIAVFAVLLGVGTGAFFVCWDHTHAVFHVTNDVESALRAGERWRADVRSATGAISLDETASGEVVTIPEPKQWIVYRFDHGEVQRQIAGEDASLLLLSKVKTSAMKTESRGSVKAWRWDLQLAARGKGPPLPLLFTFEAVPKTARQK